MKPPVRSREREPEHGGRVAAAGAGEQPPVQRPALDAAARHVAGAEHDVGAVARGVDQAREVGRVVGEVGVHLDDEVGAARERQSKPAR